MRSVNLGPIEMRMSHNVSTDKFKLRIGNHWFIFYHMKRPDKQTVGISNETGDGMYVFFADYDNIKYEKLRREILGIMDRFRISSVAILTTREGVINGRMTGNYHVVSADKFKFSELRELLGYLSCDENFKRSPNYYSSKQWVLRIYPKAKGSQKLRDMPMLSEVLTTKNKKREQSSAILRFLDTYYAAILPENKPDGNYNLRVVEYATGSA